MAMQSYSSYEFNYDVFISFRGPDTRFGFTGYLYKALSDNGIRTFIDDKELQRGDEITSSLLKKIEDSRIAVIVFSPNYATSSFCLDELVHIIYYFKQNRRLVLPVFYGTEPSHVRQQKDRYGKALADYEKRFRKNKENMERLQKWKMALTQAANLSGYHFRNEEYEYVFINKIVTEISNKIDGDNRGFGKTILARAIYNFLPAIGKSGKAQQEERYCNWSGEVNEEIVMKNLPENLQRDIKRHWFKFVKKVRIFSFMNESILDAICERLRQKLYIKGNLVLYDGDLVEKVVFIVRGKLESIGEDGIRVLLSEGDVCGEELLTWCLTGCFEHTSGNKVSSAVYGKTRTPSQRLISNETVLCLTNVEAFSIRAADLEQVTRLFARFLRSPGVQEALRYESPYWRCLAAKRIQVAWRYRTKRLRHLAAKRIAAKRIQVAWGYRTERLRHLAAKRLRHLAAKRIQVAWRYRTKRLRHLAAKRIAAKRIQVAWRYRTKRLRHLAAKRIQVAWRYRTKRLRHLAAKRIQVAWRYRMKRLYHANTSQSNKFWDGIFDGLKVY